MYKYLYKLPEGDIEENSNKSPPRCNSFPVYYPDVYLQLNMFRAFSRPLSGAQWLQWQLLILPSYRGDRRAVFAVGPAGQTTKTAQLSPRYWSMNCTMMHGLTNLKHKKSWIHDRVLSF